MIMMLMLTQAKIIWIMVKLVCWMFIIIVVQHLMLEMGKFLFVLCDCGCSCHWDTLVVIVSKSIHVFNTTCGDGNCWNVGGSNIVGDSSIIHNSLTDVFALRLNYLSIVDWRCFAIIGCCCIYVENSAVVLSVAFILYGLPNCSKFKIKTVVDSIVLNLIG